MKGLLREPLIHFAVLAALLFAVYQASGGVAEDARVIRVTKAEIERLGALYAAEAGTPPDAAELQRILADHIEAAALAAEARRLGLDDGDAVVERRLAQKMRFTLGDGGAIQPPDEASLRAWVQANGSRFRQRARYSFDHVFFQDAADPRLEQAKAQLLAGGVDWRRLGDPFILGRQAGDLPLREIARRYGRGFADALAPLEVSEEWRGPIASAFGAHLIQVTAKIDGAAPNFETIRKAAEAAWIEQARRSRQAQAVSRLVGRYRVEIDAGAAE